MPLARLRQDYSPPPPAAAAPQSASEAEQFAPSPSPALALQKHLAQRAVALNSAEIEKWSPRRSLALIVSASAALWLGILMAIAETTKLVA